VFLLGGGPSLKQVDLNSIKGRRIIAINNAYGDPIPTRGGGSHDPRRCRYVPRDWVNIVWFGDGRWLEWHIDHLRRFHGLVASCADGMDKVQGLFYYAKGKLSGICKEPDKVGWNRNSGASAINLAYHLGAKRAPYDLYLKHFNTVARDADKLGLEIINCTPGSALSCFPIMPLEEYLANEA